jgi:hypothetical protein
VYFDDAPDIYGQGFKTARVPLLAGAKRNATFYRRHGDLFGWTCVGGCAALMAFTWAQARRRQKAVV